MPVYWGPMRRGDRWMPWAAAVGLLLALAIALSAQAPAGVRVDHARERLVILPGTPDRWRICDGEAGACVPVWSLRQVTAELQEGR